MGQANKNIIFVLFYGTAKSVFFQAQHLSETKLQYDLMKKHQVQVEKQAGELLRQQRDLRKHLVSDSCQGHSSTLKR
jgi:hypothetical protein